jgi:hypothetical protein
MYINGKRCKHQGKGNKKCFARCLRDGSVRKDLCWDDCPNFKPNIWHKLVRWFDSHFHW